MAFFISQNIYVMEVLERFGIDKSNCVHYPTAPGQKLQKDHDGMKIDSTYYKQTKLYVLQCNSAECYVRCYPHR